VGFVPAVDDSTPTAPVGRAAGIVDVFVHVVVLCADVLIRDHADVGIRYARRI